MSREIAIAAFKSATEKQEALLKNMGVSTEAYTRVLMNALIKNPNLAKCTKASLYQAVIDAAEQGLAPDGRTAVLVPVKIKGVPTAQCWVMAPGMIARAHKATKSLSVNTGEVYPDDKWEHGQGTNPHITHIPSETKQKVAAELRAVYAVAFFPGNDVPQFEVMYRAEIDTFRKNTTAWINNFAEMAKVRILKRLLKRCPMPVGFTSSPMMTDDEDDIVGATDDFTIEGQAEVVPETARVTGTQAAAPAARGRVRPRKAAETQPAPATNPAPETKAAEVTETDQSEIQFENDDTETGEPTDGDMF